MRRVFLALSAALAVVALPQCLAAADAKRPDAPRPEMKAHRPAPRPEGNASRKHGGEKAKAGHREAPPDAKAMFNRLDTNKDGKLNLDEFSEGVRQLHRKLWMTSQTWSREWRGDVSAHGRKGVSWFGDECDVHGSFAKHPGCAYQPGPGWAALGQRGQRSMRHHGRHHFACAMDDGFRGGWHRRGETMGPAPCGCRGCDRQRQCPCCSRGFQGWRSYDRMARCDGFCGRRCMHGFGDYRHPYGMARFDGFGPQEMRGFRGPERPYWAAGYGHFDRRDCMSGYPEHGRHYGMDGQFGGFHHPSQSGQLEGREFSRRMDGFENRQGHEHQQHRADGLQGHKKPEAKKHDGMKRDGMKRDGMKPDAKKPEKKAAANERSVEARLTALESQQAAILVALREQQTAVMTALQQTNELINARLAAPERSQGGFKSVARQSGPERGPRELSMELGHNSWHPEQGPKDDDQD